MSDAANRLTGALASHYRIERELGAGGMATVYLAHDLKHDRQVAIKVLHQELAAALGAERFLAEIKTTARLQHPHVLPLLDSGSADGLLYYVMPFVAGESLRDRLTREKQLPIEDAVRIAREVADALGHAHGHGVIHRDIKPENILLQEGHALVADFGIALAVSAAGGARMTQTGLSLGTPQYMSPEQAMGEKTLDARADIYALGAVTYEMLTGEAPFTGATVQAIVARVLSEEPRPITSVRKTVPAHVEAAVLKALAKLPADRIGSAAEFADALTRLGSGAMTVARGVPSSSQRSTVLAAAGWISSAALLVVWLASRGPQSTDDSVRRYDIMLPDSAPMAFDGPAHTGVWQRAVAISRDGSRLVYVAAQRGTTRLFLRDMTTGATRSLDGTDGAYFPFFSPDGQRIGFFVGNDMQVVRVSGGAPLPVASGFKSAVGAVWHSPDSVLVADVEATQFVWIALSGRGKTEVEPGKQCEFATECLAVMDPDILPGGEWAIGSHFGRLSLSSLHGKGARFLTPDGPVLYGDADLASVIPGHSPKFVPPGTLLYVPYAEAALVAVAFDPVTLRTAGQPVEIVSGMRREQFYSPGQFAVSDDGTIVFAPGASNALSRLAWIDPTGRRDTLAFGAATYGGLSLSHDGGLAALFRNTNGPAIDVLVLDLRSERQSCLVTMRGSASPTWEADGGLRLAQTGVLQISQDVTRHVRLPSGSCDPLPIAGANRRMTATSSDGRWLASTLPADSAILIDATDSAKAPQSIAPAQWHAEFSPDGKWLAFGVVDAPAKILLISVPFDGRRVEVAADGGDSPRWFPDGKRLLYKRGRQFMVVDLSFSNGRVLPGRPRPYVEGPFPRVRSWSYDIDPRGRILALVGPEERSTPTLRVITNLPALIKARLGESAGR